MTLPSHALLRLLAIASLCIGPNSACTLDRVIATVRDAQSATDASVIDDAGMLDDEELEQQRVWGRITATNLAIAGCPDGGIKVLVNTTNERSITAGTVALREALAWPTAGEPLTIRFDPAHFSPDDAGIISITDLAWRFLDLHNTCIDAKGRGVIVDFAPNPTCDAGCIWSLNSSSVMVGLVIRGDPHPILVREAIVAANRFAVQGVALIAAPGAAIVRDNAFVSGKVGVRAVLDASGRGVPQIRNNTFGVDPQTLMPKALQRSVVADGPMELAYNKLNAPLTLNLRLPIDGYLHHNEIVGPLTISQQGWYIGPSNIIDGDVINERMPVGQRGNMFFTNVLRGTFTSEGMQAPIDVVTNGRVEGVCPASGWVEVYRNTPDWNALGLVQCLRAGDRWSLLSTFLSSKARIATLFTETTWSHTGPFSDEKEIP